MAFFFFFWAGVYRNRNFEFCQTEWIPIMLCYGSYLVMILGCGFRILGRTIRKTAGNRAIESDSTGFED